MKPAPEGFVLRREARAVVVLAAGIEGEARAAGLHRPWDLVAPRPPGPGTGRGPRAIVPLGTSGTRVLVKQYLRGGVLARANRERYVATARFFDELDTGRRALAAGLAVAEPLGVVLRPARPGWRAWGIARFVEDARDLAQCLADPALAAAWPAVWDAALGFARQLLDGGLWHRDLNLGNVLVIGDITAPRFVACDLDRARFVPGGVRDACRGEVLARFERSRRKVARALEPGRTTSVR